MPAEFTAGLGVVERGHDVHEPDRQRREGPDRFDLNRENREHLGWGSGIHFVSAARWPGLKSTPRWGSSSVVSAIRGSSSTRRPTGATRCSAGLCTDQWTSTESSEPLAAPAIVSIARRSRSSSGTRVYAFTTVSIAAKADSVALPEAGMGSNAGISASS